MQSCPNCRVPFRQIIKTPFLGAKEEICDPSQDQTPVSWSEENELPTNPVSDGTLINWDSVRQFVREERDRMRDRMYPGWRNDVVLLQRFFDEEERGRVRGRPG